MLYINRNKKYEHTRTDSKRKDRCRSVRSEIISDWIRYYRSRGGTCYGGDAWLSRTIRYYRIPISDYPGTTVNRITKNPRSSAGFYCAAEDTLSRFAKRDFLRAAVFFLMTPRFAALSIALYAAESAVCWSARGAPAVETATFTAPARERLVRTLNTRFLSCERIAFFAPLVIAMHGNVARALS